MANHHAPHRRLEVPSPWPLIPKLLGWCVVLFIVLFMLMFILALAGVS